MAVDLIARVGESVFGLTWEIYMAIALDVSEDALRRWAGGALKPGLYAELAVFAAERPDELVGADRRFSIGAHHPSHYSPMYLLGTPWLATDEGAEAAKGREPGILPR